MAATVEFDDGSVYEHFMGRWSRAIGTIFLNWLAAPKGAQWLDIGCGTGVFTELLLDTCSPHSTVAVDFSAAQIDYARRRLDPQKVDIRVADAQALPLSSSSFDVVVSALVINFIPDRVRALAEMRRVCRPGGYVAGYLWDFAGERSAGRPLALGLRQIGVDPPRIPGAEDSSMEALYRLFAQAGLGEIAVKSIDVTVTFAGFDDYWRSQTPAFTPIGKVVAALPEVDRMKLAEAVRAQLPVAPDGTIAYSARANAIKSRAP